jgi:hypothetical protein
VVDSRTILLARIDALIEELARASSALKAVDAEPGLKERVGDQFAVLIQQQRQALQTIEQEARTADTLDTTWSALHELQRGCASVFRELLAFVQGAMMRGAKLDRRLCAVADAMLEDFSRPASVSWDRFTILADGEFLADSTAIIRLRFPELTVWALPIAAHEFGHFAGPELTVRGPDRRSRHPFEEILERERRLDARRWWYTHEYFGDLFATYVVGPAYAATCILLRFDPANAHRDGQAHPSDAKRVYLILDMLDSMDKSSMMSPFGAIIERLRDAWAGQLNSAGIAAQLDAATIAELDALRAELHELMKVHMAPRLQYTEDAWARARVRATQFDRDLEERVPSQPLSGETIVDVLNGAWLCRLERKLVSPHVDTLGEMALDVCLRMVDARRAGTR